MTASAGGDGDRGIVVESVTLESIKSYDDPTTIDLGEGVTAIVGENGAGKSTVQEAIGYALFDTHPFTNQERLVRDGASTGRIEVTIRDVARDETYTVRRWAGRSKYDVVDADGNLLGLDGASEVKRWLCDRLGVDSPDDLPELWERSVGVPQTAFLADFAATEADRVDTFDPLFDVERYREAYKRLSGVEGVFEDEIGAKNEKIIELRTKLEALPEVEDEVETLREKRDALRAQAAELDDEIGTLETEWDELEGVRDDLEDACRKRETLVEETIPSKEAELERAEADSDEARAARETLESVREAAAEHEKARETLEALEERAGERDDLEDRLRTLDAEIEKLVDRAEQLEAAAETAAEAKERMESLRPKVEGHEELEAEVDDLEEAVDRIAEIDDRVDETDDEIAERRERREEYEATIDEIEALRDTAERLPDLREEREGLGADRKALEREREELMEQNEVLRGIDIDDGATVAADDGDAGDRDAVPCPTCDRPLDADHRDAVIAENEARITEIDAEIDDLDAEIDDLDAEMGEAEDAQERVSDLDWLRRERDSIADEIDALETERDELREERDDLTERVDDLDAKRERLAELADARERFVAARTTHENNADAADDLAEVRERIADLEATRAEVTDALDAFEGLDERIAEVEERIEETESAYETFRDNRPMAEELDERQARVESLREDLDSLHDRREALDDEIADLESAFDADRLDELEAELESLRDDRAGKRTLLDKATDDLDDAEAELESLRETAARKDELEAAVEELERDRAFAAWARDSLQQGAVDLRDLVTSEVGDRANAIFQRLRGAPRETLIWDKTYDLRVRVGGQDTPFDALSGGEKMAAALSVRLAILERLASVGAAFLDEPTANLDAEKRRNLVRQLESLDAFRQLVVVSHDRTFESMTERTVRLETDDDDAATRVVD